MAKYVLMYEGAVLPGIPDDEPADEVGYQPFTNLKRAMTAREEWAAELGGCAGNVQEDDIAIVKLVTRPQGAG